MILVTKNLRKKLTMLLWKFSATRFGLQIHDCRNRGIVITYVFFLYVCPHAKLKNYILDQGYIFIQGGIYL